MTSLRAIVQLLPIVLNSPKCLIQPVRLTLRQILIYNLIGFKDSCPVLLDLESNG